MKIFSTVSAVAVLLGVGAFMQSPTARAQLPIGTCIALASECDQGNEQACKTYELGCKGKAPLGSILSGAPPTKNNHKFDAALLSSKQNALVAK
jgi:hypothetical protein